MKVTWQDNFLSFLLKRVSLKCWMLSLRVSSDVDVTIDQENYISSSVQCKSLSVWSVTFTLTHFLSKTIFSRGYGGVQNSNGNSEGVGGGGVILVVKIWKFRGGGGAYVKFPPWWGYGYFLELHIAAVCQINEWKTIFPWYYYSVHCFCFVDSFVLFL